MATKDGDAKYQEKHRRRKGLQKTRFYCQICERQCLDENGFKLHIKSEVHMRNLNKQLKENAGNSNHIIKNFSEQFNKEFLTKLRKSHGEKYVKLSKYYQEFIKDRDHVHLNATRWGNLTQYVKYLQREKLCKVIEHENGETTEGGMFTIAYCKPGSQEDKIESEVFGEDVPIEFLEDGNSGVAATEDKIAEQIENGERMVVVEDMGVKKELLGSRKKIAFGLKKKKFN